MPLAQVIERCTHYPCMTMIKWSLHFVEMEVVVEDLVLLPMHQLCCHRYCNKFFFFSFKFQAPSCFYTTATKKQASYFILLLKEESDLCRELPQKIESGFQISKNVLNESFGFISRGIKLRTKTTEVFELIQKFKLQAKQSLQC